MRRIAILSVIFGLFVAVPSARAADLFEMPLAPIWSGLYVGGHLGGLWDDGGKNRGYKRYCEEKKDGKCKKWSEWKETDKIKFSDHDDDVTLIGGIHIGYNWQEDALVAGVEADLSFADGVDYLASLRARLGFAQDNLHVYATAGVAFVGFDDKLIKTTTYGHKHDFKIAGDNDIGLVVGGGAEYKLDSNISVGVEGLYYMFGDNEGGDSWYASYKEWKTDHEDDNDLFVVRARLNYHLTDDYEAPLK